MFKLLQPPAPGKKKKAPPPAPGKKKKAPPPAPGKKKLPPPGVKRKSGQPPGVAKKAPPPAPGKKKAAVSLTYYLFICFFSSPHVMNAYLESTMQEISDLVFFHRHPLLLTTDKIYNIKKKNGSFLHKQVSIVSIVSI